MAVVMAGDTLVRALYEYYEILGILSSDCFRDHAGEHSDQPLPHGFVPGEGLAALVMESGERYRNRGAKAYGRYRCGRMGGDPTATSFSWGQDSDLTADLIRQSLDSASPTDVRVIVAAANGSSMLDSMENRSIEKVFGLQRSAEVLTPKMQMGEMDGSALLRLAFALSSLQEAAYITGPRTERREESGWTQDVRGNLLLLLGASTGGGRAAMTFELPASGSSPGTGV